MNHEPDPTFASHLEWQIRTALRRKERFAEPVRSPALRRLGVAALVLVSLSVGAGGVIAAEHVQDARERAAAEQRRELLLAQARVQEDLARSRVEFAQRELEQAQQLFDRGVLASSELARAMAEPERERIELARRCLDREEIEITGREPETSLAAPLAAGRDFVEERLELEVRGIQLMLRSAQERHDFAARLVEHGVASQDEVLALEFEVMAAQWKLRTAQGRIDLRSGFLRGAESADRTLMRGLLLETMGRSEIQRLRVQSIERGLERARALAASGLGPDPARIEAELAQARGELQLLDLERTRLEVELSGGVESLMGLGYTDDSDK